MADPDEPVELYFALLLRFAHVGSGDSASNEES
jgi:hypothetical protein